MGDVQGPTVNLPGGTFSHIKMHDLSNETHEIWPVWQDTAMT